MGSSPLPPSLPPSLPIDHPLFPPLVFLPDVGEVQLQPAVLEGAFSGGHQLVAVEVEAAREGGREKRKRWLKMV